MAAYDRCTNWGNEILPVVLPSMVETENVLDHPRKPYGRNLFINP
jgi:hypothetical protein